MKDSLATLSMVSFAILVATLIVGWVEDCTGGSGGLQESSLSGKPSMISASASSGSWVLWLVASESEKALSPASSSSRRVSGVSLEAIWAAKSAASYEAS